MAIIIEEERGKGVSIVSVLIWLVILGIIAAAGYYLFVKNPGLITFTAPPEFAHTQALSEIDLDPEAVIRTPAFQALKQYVQLPTISHEGRANPLLGF